MIPRCSSQRTPHRDHAVQLIRHARSPESGIAGQGVRFAIAGGVVALVYTASTLLLAHVAGLAFELALAIGFAFALATHFTLQRFFVWVHHSDFALSFAPQVRRYLAVAACQYALTALSTALLPSILHVATTWIYLATVVMVSAATFFVLRHVVFHAEAR